MAIGPITETVSGSPFSPQRETKSQLTGSVSPVLAPHVFVSTIVFGS
jgi:hypothetical protein